MTPAWDPEQATKSFWASVYKARGLGQSVHVNQEPWRCLLLIQVTWPVLRDHKVQMCPHGLGKGQSIQCGEDLGGVEDGSWNVLTGISTAAPSPPEWVTSGKLFTSLASSFLICQTVLTLEEFLLK